MEETLPGIRETGLSQNEEQGWIYQLPCLREGPDSEQFRVVITRIISQLKTKENPKSIRSRVSPKTPP